MFKMRDAKDPDIILRPDGWYWFDPSGNLIGPYESRAEAIHAGRVDDDVELWTEYEID